jgi:ABC-type dipeptide/oligopeptide/nickel transport system ATPase component
MSHLLEVEDLRTHFPTRAGLVKAVDGVSFHIDEGELLGLVGESGSGKSITALSVMRLTTGLSAAWSVGFVGEELTSAGGGRMRVCRGDDIAMMCQDAMSARYAVWTGGEQGAEGLRLHR